MEIVKTVSDSVTIVLNESDLTGMKIGEYLKTPRRYIPCSDGLKWRLRYQPAGHNADSANYLSVCMYVNMEVSAKFRYELNGSVLRQSSAPYMERGAGYNKLVSHKKLRPLFTDGQLSIVFHVEFDIPVPFSFLTSRMVRFCDHLPTDFDIVVGLDRVKVHKGYISIISPVINAMLSHDTAESRSNTVKITDFDFETVKAAIDFCYGREPENLCVETIVGILRFADKYDIRAVTEDLANIPLANLYPETFATIALYAYDCSKDDLFKTCHRYFKESLSEIVITPKFTTLTPYFVAHLLKEAFHLKTPYDVLRHAHANEIGFILDPLEKTVIENISLDTFCITVKYAWECSRDNLKTACGKFFNDNQAEIRNMKAFYDLPPNVVYEVLKKGYDNVSIVF